MTKGFGRCVTTPDCSETTRAKDAWRISGVVSAEVHVAELSIDVMVGAGLLLREKTESVGDPRSTSLSHSVDAEPPLSRQRLGR
jgi:hypothetical protein